MRTLPTLPLAVVALLPTLAPAAIINATFSAGVDSDWSTPGNWSPFGVPSNDATDQFNVTIPTGQLASLDTSPTINQLNVGTGATLNWTSGRFLTCSGDITNSGLLQLIGTSTNTRLTVNDPSDHLVNLTGSGTLRLTATTQSITGVAPTVLSIGSNQRIEGFGTLSSNSIDLVNSGTLAGDSAIAPLVITPKDTLQNFGTIVAESNGKLTLSSGLFTGPGAYRIDDFGALTLSSVTLEGITLSVTNTDGDLFNNVATVAGSTTLKEFINEAKLSSNFGVLLELGGDITNNGIIEINGATTNSRISINDTVDQNVTINGTGSILLTEAQHRIQGSSGSTLTLGSGQTLRGLGNLGTNLVNLVNQGTVVADQAAGSLVLDPALTFINNGSLRAESGGIAQFNGGTYSGAGAFIISDNSEFRISSGTFENLTFTSDDLDATPGNNLISLTGSAIFDGITNNATIDITFGRTLTLVDDFINNRTVTLNGATTNSRISINDSVDQSVLLDGAGSIKLTDLAQNITGSSSHLLTIGASQTIHGTGKVGNNQLNLINQGTITADVPGTSLVIDPSTTFENFGTIGADPGCTLILNAGTYTGAGVFRIPDTAGFTLVGGGIYDGITFSNDGNPDDDLTNNDINLTGTVTFRNVTNQATVNLANATSITLADDNTNHGLIELNGTSTLTRITVNDPVDQSVLLDGSGTLRLTADEQNITGSFGHLLTNGALHTMEGYGRIGTNIINLANQGTINANVSGETIAIDPSTSFSNTGTLTTDAGATLTFIGTGHVNETTGTITGNGTVTTTSAASFTNHGTIAPGNSVGSLTIEDMTHSASSQWQFEIEGTAGPGTGHDVLHVEGDLALNGLLIPQLVGPFIPSPSDTFVIITATGDITGDFTAISQPAGIGTWTATVDEVNDQVILSFVEDTTLDFAEYQALYFTGAQIANGDADPDADFDGDGLTTFVEWIFGFDPTSPVIPVPTLTVARTGSFIDLTYPESALLPENAYVVEVETDLDLQNPWTLISESDYTRHAEIPSPGNPNIDQVTLRTNTPIWSTDPKRLFRLRFSEPVE